MQTQHRSQARHIETCFKRNCDAAGSPFSHTQGVAQHHRACSCHMDTASVTSAWLDVPLHPPIWTQLKLQMINVRVSLHDVRNNFFGCQFLQPSCPLTGTSSVSRTQHGSTPLKGQEDAPAPCPSSSPIGRLNKDLHVLQSNPSFACNFILAICLEQSRHPKCYPSLDPQLPMALQVSENLETVISATEIACVPSKSRAPSK